jgi:glycosyltransferase involved in cell wall biosynthesis
MKSGVFFAMRILVIAPTAFYNHYGCHIRIMGHLRGLQARGHRVRLVTYPVGQDATGIPTHRAPLPGLRHIPVGSSRRKIILDAILTPTALATALRFQPDIIHAYLHEGVLIGWLLAGLLRVPLSFDYQGSLTAEMIAHNFLHPDSLWHPWLQRLEHWLDQRPRAIFASTGRAITELADRGIPLERLHHLPDAVDPALFHPQSRDQALARPLQLNPAIPTIVYLGLLAPYQGIDLLLQAIARLRIPAQFLIMGFPYVQRYRQMAAELGIDAHIRFTGPIPYQSAPQRLALGDLAIAPKLNTTEGSGKLLPYMSMGLPVIATDTPAHRQYLGDWGLYAAPEPDDLARTIAQAILQLPEVRPRGQHLRDLVLAHYTWDHSTTQMESILRNML